MKIGIDARLWNETGVGRYIRNLVFQLQEIDKKNDYVLFVTSKDLKNNSFDFAQEKISNWKIICTDIHWHTLEEQLKFPKILNRENLDLVHFPYFAVPIFYNKPYVVTIHDLINDHYPTGRASTLPLPIFRLKYFSYQFIIRQAARKAKKIITVSNATKEEILDHLKVPEEKIVVTYEGVGERFLSLRATRSNPLRDRHGAKAPRDDRFFLYVGNAYPHKNLEKLINAFKEVVTEQKDLKLVFVGKDDFFYSRLEKKVAAKKQNNMIYFYHNVSDEELRYFYQNAVATVMPSFMEGFGLPALEAMSVGSLVMVSDIPSLREVCGDAAVYFDPNSVLDLKQAMLKVLENPKKFEHFKDKGRERVKDFSWKQMAEQTLEVYEKSCLSLRQS